MKLNSKDVYLNYAAVVKVESRKEFSRRIENPSTFYCNFVETDRT